jgi:hypothetical protein
MAVAPDFSLLLAGRALQGPGGAFTPLAIGILRGRADIGRLHSGTAAVVIPRESAYIAVWLTCGLAALLSLLIVTVARPKRSAKPSRNPA